MLHKLRQRAREEKGFTLIELLVVILIIGILAAIALPAFLNQREKAQDTTAKSDVRTAQTAMETYYTDKQDYSAATPTTLTGIEPALQNANNLKVTNPTATGYSVSVQSKGSHKTTFTITNNGGVVSRTCDQKGQGGCADDGTW
ncbi:MAG TPA: prepilin-type N-terminal cleavage/methylation domain-containing protein [Solirubrobacteraceae bacterium]|jgi:type IV pilus assembly protein PilA